MVLVFTRLVDLLVGVEAAGGKNLSVVLCAMGGVGGVSGPEKGGKKDTGGMTGDGPSSASGCGSREPPSRWTALMEGPIGGDGGVTSRRPPSRGAWTCAVTVDGSVAGGTVRGTEGRGGVRTEGVRPGSGSDDNPTVPLVWHNLACASSSVSCNNLGPKCLLAQAKAMS